MERRSTQTDHDQLLSTETASTDVEITDEPPFNERWDAWKLLADFGAGTVPLLVLGFFIALDRRDGQSIDPKYYDMWLNASNVLATVFPITFAAIMGRTMYEAARLCLEQGVVIDTLEQILGSRSVGAAVTTLVHLRNINFLSAMLLFVWALSPLGSQSILRVLGSRQKLRVEPTEIIQFDNRHWSGVYKTRMNSSHDDFTQTVDFLLGASVLSSPIAKRGPTDLWGNVKIPFLLGSDKSRAEWQVMDYNGGLQLERHSSLIGIPLGDIPVGNANFSIESAYIELQCFNQTQQREDSWNSTEIAWHWDDAVTDSDNLQLIPANVANGTWQGSSDGNKNRTRFAVNRFLDQDWVNRTEQSSRFLDATGLKLNNLSSPYGEDQDALAWLLDPTRLQAETDIEVEQAQLLFHDTYYSGGLRYVLEVQCDILQRYVESRVTCERWEENPIAPIQCEVTEQRASQASHPDERISHLSFPQVWSFISYYLPRSMSTISGSDILPQYLQDPLLPNVSAPISTKANLYGDLSLDFNLYMFSQRLSQIMNTYILANQLKLRATSGMSSEWAAQNVTVPAINFFSTKVYHMSPGWITLGIVCCDVLFVAGVLSVVFRHMTVGPEVLGFASTVLRDSKFIDLPPDMGRMAGLDISRMLKGQRVRYGYTDLTGEGKPLLGVGRAEETRLIQFAPGERKF